MNKNLEYNQISPAERLVVLSNLVELALYAPEGEVTRDGRGALQWAAREVTMLSSAVSKNENYL